MPGFHPVQFLKAGGTLLDLSQDCYTFDFGIDTSAARGPTDYKVTTCQARPLACGIFGSGDGMWPLFPKGSI